MIRLLCFFCGKSVSSPAPDDLIIRAVMVCPECIESGQVRIEGKGILDVVEVEEIKHADTDPGKQST